MRALFARLDLTARTKLALLVGGLVFGIVAPYILDQFIVGLLALALITGLFAMSIDLMAGYAGLVTLGHAGVLAAAMYGSGYMASKTDAGFATQILVGYAVGMLASAIFGAMAMRSSGVYFIMVTIAQGMIVWGLSIRMTKVTGAENGLLGIDRPELLVPYYTYYWFILAIVAICALALYIIVKSPFGLALKGLRESETRMKMLGHNTAFLKFYMFMISGFFASTAGILRLFLNEFVSPSDVVLRASAIPVLMSILGGIGTLVGPMVGSFVITFIENYLSLSVDRWPTLMGLIFIFVVLFARQGIVGSISTWWYKRVAHSDDGATARLAVSAALERSES